MELINRPRRLRQNEAIRRMCRETRLSVDSLIYPIFVDETLTGKRPIPALDGQYHYGVDAVNEAVEECLAAGIRRGILFGLPAEKDAQGSSAWDKKGVIQEAIHAIKAKHPEFYLITDVCMCEYTDHGHCGILCGHEVDNDKTLEVLSKTALSHVEAGADMVAPSDMMDGRIAAIRAILDQHDHQRTLQMRIPQLEEFMVNMPFVGSKRGLTGENPLREHPRHIGHRDENHSHQRNQRQMRHVMPVLRADHQLQAQEGGDITQDQRTAVSHENFQFAAEHIIHEKDERRTYRTRPQQGQMGIAGQQVQQAQHRKDQYAQAGTQPVHSVDQVRGIDQRDEQQQRKRHPGPCRYRIQPEQALQIIDVTIRKYEQQGPDHLENELALVRKSGNIVGNADNTNQHQSRSEKEEILERHHCVEGVELPEKPAHEPVSHHNGRKKRHTAQPWNLRRMHFAGIGHVQDTFLLGNQDNFRNQHPSYSDRKQKPRNDIEVQRQHGV